MTRSHTLRGTIAKAIIAFAVLLPALLILATALRTRMQLTGLRIGSLTPWIVADAIILGFGLLLHSGEDL
jgi:hypothetical protein